MADGQVGQDEQNHDRDHGDDRELTAGAEPEAHSEEWRRLLLGIDPRLPALRRAWRLVPSAPRCKLCAAPFHGPGRVLTRVIMHGRSSANPLLCSTCFGGLRGRPGGAEVPLSVVFADIRGSTGIAEQIGAAEFTRLVQRFYVGAARAVDDHGGIVDKFLGDGVMALFIPIIAGEAHAARAVTCGEAILASHEAVELAKRRVFIGVGAHTGEAFVGAVGSGDKIDFSALGDTINVAARLGALAGPGELLVSAIAWRVAERAAVADPRDARTITVAGREAPLDVVVVRSPTAHAAAA